MSTKSLLLMMLPAFCECLVLVGIHSYLGIHVIRRKVIFVDLAFAQIAALGTLIAFLFGVPPHTGGSFAFALSLTVMGAAVFSLCRFRKGKIPQEAVIGLVYAIAAAAAILLIDKAPHGAEHLKEIMTGSILWVSWSSILTAAVVYSAVGAFHFIFRKRFLLISRDPEAAWEAGINVRLWDFLFYLSFGVVITVSVDVAGVLIVFVFLVAPAILALLISDRISIQLLVGWGLGLMVTTIGLVLAYVGDLSTGPAVIATYGVIMLVVAGVVHIVRAPRRAVALRNTGLVLLAFAVGGLALTLLGRTLGAKYEDRDLHAECEHTRVVEAEPDPGAQAESVLAAFDADVHKGAEQAVAFLQTDPPPFFGQLVLDRLAEEMGEDPGFDSDESMESPVNQRAIERVRNFFDP